MKRSATAVLLGALLGASAGCSQPAPNDPATLYVGVYDDLSGLDPVEHPRPAVEGIASEVFEGLVRLRPGTFEVEPALASSWSVSSDGSTWTFPLRPNVKFSDGTALDGPAVKANFDRWRLSNDPNREGLDYPAYAERFGGFDAQSVIDDVRVIAPASVVIHTRMPFAPLLRYLTLPSFGIGSPAAFGNDYKLYDEIPVGSGPYRVTDYEAGDHVTLTANPLWRGPAPRVPSILVRSLPDPSTAVLALEKDDVDAVVDPPADVAHDMESRDTMHLARWPSNATCFLVFDLDRPPFDDPRARRGVAEALDRAQMAGDFGDRAARPARGWLPPGMLGEDPDVAEIGYDPAAARTLLGQANATHEPVTLYYPSTPDGLLPDPDGIAHDIQRQLAAVGLTVNLNATDSLAIPANVSGGAFALGVASAESGDPDELLLPFATSWHDPNFASAANQGRATLDDRARGAIYRRIESLIAEQVPGVPLVHPTRVAGISTRAAVSTKAALLPP